MGTTTGAPSVWDLAEQAISAGMVETDDIVEWVVERIGPDQVWQALRQALRPVAIDRCGFTRRNGTRPGERTRSARWENVAGRCQVYLSSPLAVPGVGHKPVRDCTADEIAATATARHDLAASTELAAQRLDLLHQTMLDYGATIVGDLPDDAVMKVIEWRP